MKKKLVGILVCTLLIATVVIPVSGAGNVAKNQNNEKDIPSYIDMNKPDPPVMSPIIGPTKVPRFQWHTWSFMATDPDNDPLTIYINWGDTTLIEDFSATSGINYGRGHLYGFLSINKDTCIITAWAMDINGEESDKVNLTVELPRNRASSDVISNNRPLVRLIEQFPNAFPLLRYILGLQ